MIMNGSITWTRPMITAKGVYSSFTGCPPRAVMPWLTRPSAPSSRLQPKARTTTEISNGVSTSIRKIERHGAPMRLSTKASGMPISTHSRVTRALIQKVRKKIS
ncbi:hypothetical protein D3C81_2022180 [compost metagenome]